MNFLKGFQTEIKLFLLVVLVAIFISVAGILLLRTMQSAPVPTPTPPVQQTPPPEPQPQTEVLDISNWQTYRNDEFGFEVKYPANVSTQELSDLILFSVNDRPCNAVPSHKCPIFMEITSMYNITKVEPDEGLESIIEKSLALPGFEVKEFEVSAEDSNWSIDLVKKITFGKENVQGYLIHDWGMSTGRCTYFGKQNNITIQISRSAVGLINSSCDDDQLFSQVLATFRFVK